MLLHELLAGMPESALIPGLLNNVEALLPSIDPGSRRDENYAAYIAMLARRMDPERQERARNALGKITSLPTRMRLCSLLAEAAARARGKAEAAQIVARAIEECRPLRSRRIISALS